MVLEVRVIGRQVPVVVDADHKGISLIVLKSVEVFLTPDLVHGNIRTVSVFEFHKQRGLLRIPGRGQINNIRIALAGVKLQNRGIILSGGVISQLDAVT